MATIALKIVLFTVCFTAVYSICPNGWMRYDTSCYLFEDAKVSWHTAQTYCERLNAHLVVVETPCENNFLKETLRKFFSQSGGNTGREFCMDGNDIAVENDWVRFDGRQITYTDWAAGEPNEHTLYIDQNCIRFDGEAQYKWDDYICDSNLTFICEIETE